jgi:hypothetical protein
MMHSIYAYVAMNEVQTIFLLERITSVNDGKKSYKYSFNTLDMARRFLLLIFSHMKQIQTKGTVVSCEISRAQQGRGIPFQNAPIPET